MTSLRLTMGALALVAFVGAAHAQGTPQQRAACRSDVARLCKGLDDTGAIHGCLQQKRDRVSARCQKVLDGQM